MKHTRPVPAPSRLSYAFILFMLMSNGCDSLSSPSFNNPYDPYSLSFRMNAPTVGTIHVSSTRVATIPIYYVDPYASEIHIERREGTDADFLHLGIVPLASKVYYDTIPPSSQHTFYYKARVRAPGGAYSPYSFPREAMAP